MLTSSSTGLSLDHTLNKNGSPFISSGNPHITCPASGCINAEEKRVGGDSKERGGAGGVGSSGESAGCSVDAYAELLKVCAAYADEC